MLNAMIKNNAGFDLKQLSIGSEGSLGVITRAVTSATAYCGMAGFEAALVFLQRARRELSGLLFSFEIMCPAYYDLIITAWPRASIISRRRQHPRSGEGVGGGPGWLTGRSRDTRIWYSAVDGKGAFIGQEHFDHAR